MPRPARGPHRRTASALPAGRQPQTIARLAARPAEPRLHPGLDLLIRGRRVLTPHPLSVHSHPGVAQVEDHPELLNISSGHDAILGASSRPSCLDALSPSPSGDLRDASGRGTAIDGTKAER